MSGISYAPTLSPLYKNSFLTSRCFLFCLSISYSLSIFLICHLPRFHTQHIITLFIISFLSHFVYFLHFIISNADNRTCRERSERNSISEQVYLQSVATAAQSAGAHGVQGHTECADNALHCHKSCCKPRYEKTNRNYSVRFCLLCVCTTKSHFSGDF